MEAGLGSGRYDGFPYGGVLLRLVLRTNLRYA
jgi:hypothetical protein